MANLPKMDFEPGEGGAKRNQSCQRYHASGRLKPPDHVEAVQPHIAFGAVVEGVAVAVAVVADLGANLEDRVEVVGQADGAADVVAGEAVARTVLVLSPLVAEGEEVVVGELEHGVIE